MWDTLTLSYEGTSQITPCGNTKEDLDGRTTPKSTLKKLKIKVKSCATNARSLDTSSLNVLT
ncbi:hypothetical protein CR513_53707, partial [Mucuna pruriens]